MTAMIRWICGVKLSNDTSTKKLLKKLCITDIDSVLRKGSLRWLGQVELNSCWISQVRKLKRRKEREGKTKTDLGCSCAKDRECLDTRLIDSGDRRAQRGLLRCRISNQATTSK